MNEKVDRFLRQAKAWREEMETLREIALAAELVEEFKWGKPCYTSDGANIAIIQPFKNECALMFFKGALLKDPDALLIAVGPNARSARRCNFTDVTQIKRAAPKIERLLHEAIQIEESGAEVPKLRGAPAVPPEVDRALAQVKGLKAAFRRLTPGRQRGYLIHFSSAKQDSTLRARVERCASAILEGRGLHDR